MAVGSEVVVVGDRFMQYRKRVEVKKKEEKGEICLATQREFEGKEFRRVHKMQKYSIGAIQARERERGMCRTTTISVWSSQAKVTVGGSIGMVWVYRE